MQQRMRAKEQNMTPTTNAPDFVAAGGSTTRKAIQNDYVIAFMWLFFSLQEMLKALYFLTSYFLSTFQDGQRPLPTTVLTANGKTKMTRHDDKQDANTRRKTQQTTSDEA